MRFYNDMGHLMTTPGYDTFPKHIIEFAYQKANVYLNVATDVSGLGCRFYCVKPGLQNVWTYFCGQDKICITFDVNTFCSVTMRYVSPVD